MIESARKRIWWLLPLAIVAAVLLPLRSPCACTSVEGQFVGENPGEIKKFLEGYFVGGESKARHRMDMWSVFACPISEDYTREQSVSCEVWLASNIFSLKRGWILNFKVSTEKVITHVEAERVYSFLGYVIYPLGITA